MYLGIKSRLHLFGCVLSCQLLFIKWCEEGRQSIKESYHFLGLVLETFLDIFSWTPQAQRFLKTIFNTCVCLIINTSMANLENETSALRAELYAARRTVGSLQQNLLKVHKDSAAF